MRCRHVPRNRAGTEEKNMKEITDDYMRDMLSKSRSYTVLLLKATPEPTTPETRAIVWEHGRRNFSLLP